MKYSFFHPASLLLVGKKNSKNQRTLILNREIEHPAGFSP
jgi:hypothetical protein